MKPYKRPEKETDPAKYPGQIVNRHPLQQPYLKDYIDRVLEVEGLKTCQHEWHIWPETDGLEQRCSLCRQHRATPEQDKFWKRG